MGYWVCDVGSGCACGCVGGVGAREYVVGYLLYCVVRLIPYLLFVRLVYSTHLDLLFVYICSAGPDEHAHHAPDQIALRADEIAENCSGRPYAEEIKYWLSSAIW